MLGLINDKRVNVAKTEAALANTLLVFETDSTLEAAETATMQPYKTQPARQRIKIQIAGELASLLFNRPDLVNTLVNGTYSNSKTLPSSPGKAGVRIVVTHNKTPFVHDKKKPLTDPANKSTTDATYNPLDKSIFITEKTIPVAMLHESVHALDGADGNLDGFLPDLTDKEKAFFTRVYKHLAEVIMTQEKSPVKRFNGLYNGGFMDERELLAYTVEMFKFNPDLLIGLGKEGKALYNFYKNYFKFDHYKNAK